MMNYRNLIEVFKSCGSLPAILFSTARFPGHCRTASRVGKKTGLIQRSPLKLEAAADARYRSACILSTSL